ncbi:MAG: hypothetical protein GXP61_08165 [Epsilonproteobacteria bacterium]|nr:hypothetical protein [Campylobacterota bacterium]
MNTRESKKIKQNREVLDYEHNLKLHLASENRVLDALTRTVMPNQISIIKTILWINFLMLGIIAQLYRSSWSQSLTGFVVLAVSSIIICLVAMAFFRDIQLGGLNDLQAMSKYKDNKWTKSQALFDFLSSTRVAIDSNTKNQNRRSDLTNIATIFSIINVIYLAFILSN